MNATGTKLKSSPKSSTAEAQPEVRLGQISMVRSNLDDTFSNRNLCETESVLRTDKDSEQVRSSGAIVETYDRPHG